MTNPLKLSLSTLTALAIALSAATTTTTAAADVVRMSPLELGLALTPGILLTTGGVATAVGTGTTLDDERALGWEVSSYVLGGLNGVSSGLYFLFGAAEEEHAGFTYSVAIANGLTSIANISVAIASSARDDESADNPPPIQPVDLRIGTQIIADVAGASTPTVTLSGRF